MRLSYRAYTALSLAAAALAAGACADDPRRAERGPCDHPVGGLLDCPPPGLQDGPLTIEEACERLVGCGAYALEGEQDGQNQDRDYLDCINRLRGNDFPADRLEFALTCVAVSTCQDLREEHCLDFGGMP